MDYFHVYNNKQADKKKEKKKGWKGWKKGEKFKIKAGQIFAYFWYIW